MQINLKSIPALIEASMSMRLNNKFLIYLSYVALLRSAI